MTPEGPASATACALTVAIFAPYLRRIWRNDARPRAASWIVWGISTLLVGGGQVLAGGGWGAAPILVSGACSSLVAVLAYRQAEGWSAGTHSDRWCLGVALGCLPLWIVTGDPLWSVLILTGIDLLGFVPTMRAIRLDPSSESILLFAAFALRNLIAIAALDAHNLTTVVFPAVIGVACGATAVWIAMARRRMYRTT